MTQVAKFDWQWSNLPGVDGAIEIGMVHQNGGNEEVAFYVKDNGAGLKG
jgi:hypothetical protein